MSDNVPTLSESERAPQSASAETAPGRRSPLRTLLDTLASVKFAVSVVIFIALACVAGTLLPQGAETTAFVEKHPAFANWLPLLRRFGFTNMFYSWGFITLLCALAASVAACTSRRVATIRRTIGLARRRAIGSMITHISILLILAGGVVRGVWGETGYIELRAGETKREFLAEDKARPLPFALQLTKFEVQTDEGKTLVGGAPKKDTHQLIVQWPARYLSARVPIRLNVTHALTPQGEQPTTDNTFKIKVLKYVPDFSMNSETHEIASRSEAPNNPAVLVEVAGPSYQNNRWVFANYPDRVVHSEGDQPNPLRIIYQRVAATPEAPPAITGTIRNFQSTLKIVDGPVVRAEAVAVNRPVSYKGYTLYQTGYDPKDLSWTSLQVVRDPGVPLVYAGFALIIVGLSIVFYLNPWLESRKARA
jgi:cytochrome c biogenesis protein ResB